MFTSTASASDVATGGIGVMQNSLATTSIGLTENVITGSGDLFNSLTGNTFAGLAGITDTGIQALTGGAIMLVQGLIQGWLTIVG